MQKNIDRTEALSKLEILLHKKISGTLNGYGFILYLEFGTLTTVENTTGSGKNFDSFHGEYTLVIDGLWKFIEDNIIVIDSTQDDYKKINHYLKKLINSEITAYSINNQTLVTEITFDKKIKLLIEQYRDDKRLWAIRELERDNWFCFEL